MPQFALPEVRVLDRVFTLNEAALYLNLNRETVMKLIESGVLKAFDSSKAGSKRPQWKITPESIRDFIASRQFHPGVRRYSTVLSERLKSQAAAKKKRA